MKIIPFLLALTIATPAFADENPDVQPLINCAMKAIEKEGVYISPAENGLARVIPIFYTRCPHEYDLAYSALGNDGLLELMGEIAESSASLGPR